MPILEGDIKIVTTQVMGDGPEGGGAPTGIVVVDGASNAIFPDISDDARAGGQVSLRKIAVHVDTDDVDDWLGANFIIAEPPEDPNVSITMFSTGETFDRRAAAVSRIEAYLSIGVQYAGYLYGNHIAGQSTLLIFQKTSDLPAIGDTLVLTKREGFADQAQEYVRVTEAKATLRTFEDDRGTYERWELNLKLLNPLTEDFPGFDISRFEYTKAQIAQLTKISDDVVANAAKYYGVTPLQVPASVGDFTFKGESIFTQLVPSAQVETPIADARTNQLSVAVVATGAPVTRTFTAVFSVVQSLFIGGAIGPGTLSVASGGVTVTDSGGRLMSAGSQVGTVDYENGILSLTVNVFGTGGVPLTTTYAPAAVPTAVNRSQGIEVTSEGRAQSYTRTFEPAPARATLVVSYMAQGRWYVLREMGDGSIRGLDSGYGSGNLNFDTGTMSVTLGALPDVGSYIILQWVRPDASRATDVLVLDNDGNLYWPFNTSGASSLEPGAKALEPGAAAFSWDDGVPRSAHDDGNGRIVGDATGTVLYSRGVARLSPNVLPAPGTLITMTTATRDKAEATVTIASGSGSFGVTDITPGSVEFTVEGQLRGQYEGGTVFDWGSPTTYRIVDNAAGQLFLLLGDTRLAVGTVDYAAGTFVLIPNVTVPTATARLLTAWDNLFVLSDEWMFDITG